MNNKILICTVGLPLSGKSTWAKKQVKPIVNPDSIRLAFYHERFNRDGEPWVWAMAPVFIESLFLAGHSHVILDATNTTESRREKWKSDKWETYWKVIDTSREVCILRARDIMDDVIIPVIDRMAKEIVFPTSDLWD